MRHRNLGVDYRFLADFVDEVFYAKYPAWRGKKLGNGSDQAAMRQEWMAIATTTMDKLAALPPNLRRKLGTYKTVSYDEWMLDLGEAGKTSATLDALADARMNTLFPELKGKPLNPKTNGQVWYALAEEQLPQAKTKLSGRP
jgi:serine/threonine protein kinase, bacterial